MKRVILALAASLVWPQASAQSDRVLTLCGEIETAAAAAMEARQEGVPISTLMKAYLDLSGNEAQASLSKQIVIKAYEEPLWRTQESKERAITEYGNDAYLECIKKFKDAE